MNRILRGHGQSWVTLLAGRLSDGPFQPPPGGRVPELVWVDPLVHALRLAEIHSELQGADEIREQIQAVDLDEGDRRIFSYVVGRDYEMIRIWESEDDLRMSPLPFFRVRWKGLEYGAEDMGLGELCAFYLLWAVRRATKGSVVLLEEPEAFLVPVSQERLMNFLAMVAVRNRHSVLVTTHSPIVLERIPLQHIRALRRVERGFESLVPATRSAALQPLGLQVQKRGVVFVEDRLAKSVLSSILRYALPGLLFECSIQVAEGKDGAIKAIADWPIPHEVFSGVAVLDADVTLDAQRPERVLSLPGEGSPEVQIKAALRRANAAGLAVRGTSPDEFARIDIDLEGMDPHDWLPNCADRLGVPLEELIAFGVAQMAGDHLYAEAMDRLAKVLAQLVHAD